MNRSVIEQLRADFFRLLEKPTNAVPQIVVVHDWKYELRARMAPAGEK